jgi:catechol 2,3-dioxygenase-like lactoylglutathione lyase family enzyme
MSGLPLLGAFHEFSVASGDVRAAVDFYERLDFTQATTTDAYSHPYGVLTDGRLFIGLHQRPVPSPVLTFVRSGVARCVPAFADAGVELTVCHTGEDVFNEIGFTDPEPSLCGDFAEVSLPVADFSAAQAFWESLGFVAAAEEEQPYPHMSLTSDHLDVAFHHPRLYPRPMLVFSSADMPARIARLRQLGVPFAPPPRGVAAGALIEAPDDTALLLLAAAD